MAGRIPGVRGPQTLQKRSPTNFPQLPTVFREIAIFRFLTPENGLWGPKLGLNRAISQRWRGVGPPDEFQAIEAPKHFKKGRRPISLNPHRIPGNCTFRFLNPRSGKNGKAKDKIFFNFFLRKIIFEGPRMKKSVFEQKFFDF